MSNCDNTSSKTESTINEKLVKFLSKFSYWIVGLLLSISIAMWNTTQNRIDSLENKVTVLFQEKVGRPELKEEMSLVRQQIDKMYTEVARGQEQLRGDILSRLELIIRFTGNNNMQ